MGCRLSSQEPNNERMTTTTDLGWQRQPSIAHLTVTNRLDLAYRNALHQTRRRSVSLLGINRNTSQSASLVRVSFLSESASVKLMEQSDDELSSRSSTLSRNITSIYSSSYGENRPGLKRRFVTYAPHSPYSESNNVIPPSLSRSSSRSLSQRSQINV